VRAERNLIAALDAFDPSEGAFDLEVIDVFTDANRALSEGVIATPTLVAQGPGRAFRLVGDFADEDRLMEFLKALRTGEG